MISSLSSASAFRSSLRGALGGEPRRLGLERGRTSRDAGEIAHVDARHEHAAAREDLDELLLREPAQRLPHRRAPDAELLDQLPLVDQRARCELE